MMLPDSCHGNRARVPLEPFHKEKQSIRQELLFKEKEGRQPRGKWESARIISAMSGL